MTWKKRNPRKRTIGRRRADAGAGAVTAAPLVPGKLRFAVTCVSKQVKRSFFELLTESADHRLIFPKGSAVI